MSDITVASRLLSARGTAWVGWAIALASTLAFSVAPPITKAAIDLGLNPTLLLMLRFLITTLLLSGTVTFTAPRERGLARRGLLISIGVGLITGIGMLAFFWSLTRINASVASMIFSLYPLGVLGLLALRGEKFTYRNTIRLALGLGGVYLLIGPGGNVAWIGVLLVAIAIVTSCLHSVLIQWYLQEYDGRLVTLYTVVGMTIIIVGFWLFQGAQWRSPGWQGWLAIGSLAVVSTYFARLGFFAAMRRIGGGQLALMAPLETLFTVIWSVLFLRERLTFWQWVGGGLILLSMVLAMKRLQRVQRPEDKPITEEL